MIAIKIDNGQSQRNRTWMCMIRCMFTILYAIKMASLCKKSNNNKKPHYEKGTHGCIDTCWFSLSGFYSFASSALVPHNNCNIWSHIQNTRDGISIRLEKRRRKISTKIFLWQRKTIAIDYLSTKALPFKAFLAIPPTTNDYINDGILFQVMDKI